MAVLDRASGQAIITPPSLTGTRSRATLWSACLLAGLLVAATASRIINLEAFTGKFDEGIRLEQLFLMQAGYRPVRDIFAAQGPLSLDIFYGPYLLFGQTLAAARAAVVIASLLGILAVFWVGTVVSSRLGGLLAAALLVLSPLYLKNSRLALLEVPALLPATVALGGALAYQATSGRRWLLLSAMAFSVALLIKPMVVGVGLPILLALLLRPGRRLSDLLWFGGVGALVGVVIVALYGFEQVWQQVVVYREAARRASGWSLRENWSIMAEELRDEALALYALALFSGLLVAARQPRWGLPVAVWPLTNLGVLLLYSPLQFKHVAILLPPLTLVVGAGAAMALRATGSSLPLGPPGEEVTATARRAPPATLATAAALLLLSLWYLALLPATLRQSWLVMSAAGETRVDTYADETELLPQLTAPDDFVIVDEPIVAFNSRRRVPPSLVDPSSYRIRSGSLTGSAAIQAAERFDVKLLFLFSDGLRELKAFEDYVDGRYRAVKIYERQNSKDRAIYLRDDADFESARKVLAAGLQRAVRAEFGGDLRLLGYNLGRAEIRAGSSTNLTLYWEALRPMAVDYHVITRLRGSDGQDQAQSQRSLGGGGEGTASWEAGRWVFRSQVLAVSPRTPSGEYQLSVALYDSKNRISPPLTPGDALGATELTLESLRVR